MAARWRLSALLACLGATWHFLLAQWGPTVRLSNSEVASSADVNPPLVADGQFVNAFWSDTAAEGRTLFSSRSTDCGTTWGAPTQIAQSVGRNLSHYPPHEYITGYVRQGRSGVLHLLYSTPGISGSVCYMRSTDNGATWAPAETLGIVSSYSQLATDRDGYVYFIGHANPPYIQTVQRSTDDGCTWGPVDTLFHHVLNIFTDRDHVFCFGYRSTLDTLLLTISTDRGASWEAGAAITPFGNLPYTAIDESGALHVAWNDNRSGNYEIYYTRSLDHGASWCPQQRLTISSDASMMWLGTQGSAVYISYVVSGVCYKRVSLDGGVSWEAESRWPWNSGPTSNLCVGALADAGRIHLLHLQWGLGPAYWIQYRRSTDFGATWPDSAAVSDSNSLDRYPDAVVCEGNDVHVLWEDYASGNFEVYYRRGTGLAGSNETANPPVGHRPSIHLQAKANPCTPPVILKALLPEQGAADLRVYDVLGREVRCIQVVRTCDSPIVTLTWDGNDGAGRPAPSGIYLLWLCAEGNDAGVRCAVLRR